MTWRLLQKLRRLLFQEPPHHPLANPWLRWTRCMANIRHGLQSSHAHSPCKEFRCSLATFHVLHIGGDPVATQVVCVCACVITVCHLIEWLFITDHHWSLCAHTRQTFSPGSIDKVARPYIEMFRHSCHRTDFVGQVACWTVSISSAGMIAAATWLKAFETAIGPVFLESDQKSPVFMWETLRRLDAEDWGKCTQCTCYTDLMTSLQLRIQTSKAV